MDQERQRRESKVGKENIRIITFRANGQDNFQEELVITV